MSFLGLSIHLSSFRVTLFSHLPYVYIQICRDVASNEIIISHTHIHTHVHLARTTNTTWHDSRTGHETCLSEICMHHCHQSTTHTYTEKQMQIHASRTPVQQIHTYIRSDLDNRTFHRRVTGVPLTSHIPYTCKQASICCTFTSQTRYKRHTSVAHTHTCTL